MRAILLSLLLIQTGLASASIEFSFSTREKPAWNLKKPVGVITAKDTRGKVLWENEIYYAVEKTPPTNFVVQSGYYFFGRRAVVFQGDVKTGEIQKRYIAPGDVVELYLDENKVMAHCRIDDGYFSRPINRLEAPLEFKYQVFPIQKDVHMGWDFLSRHNSGYEDVRGIYPDAAGTVTPQVRKTCYDIYSNPPYIIWGELGGRLFEVYQTDKSNPWIPYCLGLAHNACFDKEDNPYWEKLLKDYTHLPYFVHARLTAELLRFKLVDEAEQQFKLTKELYKKQVPYDPPYATALDAGFCTPFLEVGAQWYRQGDRDLGYKALEWRMELFPLAEHDVIMIPLINSVRAREGLPPYPVNGKTTANDVMKIDEKVTLYSSVPTILAFLCILIVWSFMKSPRVHRVILLVVFVLVAGWFSYYLNSIYTLTDELSVATSFPISYSDSWGHPLVLHHIEKYRLPNAEGDYLQAFSLFIAGQKEAARKLFPDIDQVFAQRPTTPSKETISAGMNNENIYPYLKIDTFSLNENLLLWSIGTVLILLFVILYPILWRKNLKRVLLFLPLVIAGVIFFIDIWVGNFVYGYLVYIGVWILLLFFPMVILFRRVFGWKVVVFLFPMGGFLARQKILQAMITGALFAYATGYTIFTSLYLWKSVIGKGILTSIASGVSTRFYPICLEGIEGCLNFDLTGYEVFRVFHNPYPHWALLLILIGVHFYAAVSAVRSTSRPELQET